MRSTRTSSSGAEPSAGLLDIARNTFDRETFRRTLAEAMSHLGVLPPEGVFAERPQLAAARG